MTDPLNLNTQR